MSRNLHFLVIQQLSAAFRSRVLAVVAGFALAVAFSPAAFAQNAVGFRAGVSANPDQFYFGGHVELGPVWDKLWFRPNLEIGIGDSASLVALNGEFAYFLPFARKNQWSAYFGAGPALDVIHHSAGHASGNTDAGGGFNILLGISHVRGFFSELKFGAWDSPSLKFGVGYTFRR